MSENCSRSWRARGHGAVAPVQVTKSRRASGAQPTSLSGSESTLSSWGRSADMLALGRGHTPVPHPQQTFATTSLPLAGLVGTVTAQFQPAAWSGRAGSPPGRRRASLCGWLCSWICPPWAWNTHTSPLLTPAPTRALQIHAPHHCSLRPARVPQVCLPHHSSLPSPCGSPKYMLLTAAHSRPHAGPRKYIHLSAAHSCPV